MFTFDRKRLPSGERSSAPKLASRQPALAPGMDADGAPPVMGGPHFDFAHLPIMPPPVQRQTAISQMSPLPTPSHLLKAYLIHRAANFYPDQPLHSALTWHYGYGEGATFELTLDGMRMVRAEPIDLFDEKRFKGIDAASKSLHQQLLETDDASTSREVSMPVSDAGLGRCRNPSIGTFTVEVDGVLTARSGSKVHAFDEFAGVMSWRDPWDFDTRWWNRIKNALGMEAKKESRPLMAEIVTTLGMALPGTPFWVQSSKYEVRQQRWHSLEWAGADSTQP